MLAMQAMQNSTMPKHFLRPVRLLLSTHCSLALRCSLQIEDPKHIENGGGGPGDFPGVGAGSGGAGAGAGPMAGSLLPAGAPFGMSGGAGAGAGMGMGGSGPAGVPHMGGSGGAGSVGAGSVGAGSVGSAGSGGAGAAGAPAMQRSISGGTAETLGLLCPLCKGHFRVRLACVWSLSFTSPFSHCTAESRGDSVLLRVLLRGVHPPGAAG
jgi:hypothetical protein